MKDERPSVNMAFQIKQKNRTGIIQIVPPLLKLLKQMNLHKYPGHYYLFSDDFYTWSPSDQQALCTQKMGKMGKKDATN